MARFDVQVLLIEKKLGNSKGEGKKSSMWVLIFVSGMNLEGTTEGLGKTIQDVKIAVGYHFSIHKTCADLIG